MRILLSPVATFILGLVFSGGILSSVMSGSRFYFLSWNTLYVPKRSVLVYPFDAQSVKVGFGNLQKI